MERRDHILGGLWGMAVGNVLGLSLEGCSRDRARGAYRGTACLPMVEAERPWDDDLALGVELGEWCLGEAPDPEALLRRYLHWFQVNGRGIGNLTRRVLAKAGQGDAMAARSIWEVERRIGLAPQGNGSIMRVGPLGLALADDPQRLAMMARMDAGLTHWDPVCIEGSAFIALVTAALVREEGEPISWALAHMETRLPRALEEAIAPCSLRDIEGEGLDGANQGHAVLAVKVAMAALRSNIGFQDGVLWVLRQGGDTDTNGAIVGALLGARDGYRAVPEAWRACVSDADRLNLLGEDMCERTLLGACRGKE